VLLSKPYQHVKGQLELLEDPKEISRLEIVIWKSGFCRLDFTPESFDVSDAIVEKNRVFLNRVVRSVVNFINILRAAFWRTDPKSAKNTVKQSVFFALLGSTHAKAAHKMLMKLTLVANFINILQAAFVPIFFWLKIKKPNCKYIKATQNTFKQKSCS